MTETKTITRHFRSYRQLRANKWWPLEYMTRAMTNKRYTIVLLRRQIFKEGTKQTFILSGNSNGRLSKRLRLYWLLCLVSWWYKICKTAEHSMHVNNDALYFQFSTDSVKKKSDNIDIKYASWHNAQCIPTVTLSRSRLIKENCQGKPGGTKAAPTKRILPKFNQSSYFEICSEVLQRHTVNKYNKSPAVSARNWSGALQGNPSIYKRPHILENSWHYIVGPTLHCRLYVGPT